MDTRPAALQRTFTKHVSALREVIENADDSMRKALVKELKQLLKELCNRKSSTMRS